MFILDDVTFIHFPKCAGTSIHDNLLEQRKDDIHSLRFHASVDTIPHKYWNTRKIALIRNPVTWYDSYLSFEKNRLLRGQFIFFPTRFILLKDFLRNKQQFCTNDEAIERALNFKEFMESNPLYIEKFRNVLRDFRKPQLFHNVYSDITEIDPRNFGDTLFREFFRIYGLKEVELFKYESQIEEVCDILKINMGVISNTSTEKFFGGHENKILLKEKSIIERLGYE